MTLLSRRSFLALGAAGLLGAGAYGGVRYSRRRSDLAGTLSPAAAHEAARAGEILLVDIRRPDEWARTGVPEHATPIDMRAADFLAQLRAARRAPDQPVAVICARGVRSARLTRKLEQAGIAPIIDVPEGMLGSSAGPGWLAQNLPTTTRN